jgi:hypothetical protein
MVTVSLLLATICFSMGVTETCHPVLVGKDTPIGTFPLVQRYTDDVGYGGDVLQFTETPTLVYAIHRTWTQNYKQHRETRLKSHNPKDRVITMGCINVDPLVYAQLVECCANETIQILER